MIKLSVVIITFNEERNIERCLNSVKNIADEILVVDSFSTDNTKEICLKYRVKFIENAFEGHIEQKNFAMRYAENEWVLSLDADEALTPELEQIILKMKENPTCKGYSMNRRTYYCGHWVKYCGWYPDKKTRLINKKFGAWAGVNPHDRLELSNNEQVKHLKGDLLHYSYYTKEDHYKQIEYFGNIAAKELFKKGKNTGWLIIYSKTIFQFIKSFILKRGVLDGITGFNISRRSAFATYTKYTKLIELHKNAKQ